MKNNFYAPDNKHHWVVLDVREWKDMPDQIEIDGRYFVTRNYAGQCWGYEVEKVEKDNGSLRVD